MQDIPEKVDQVIEKLQTKDKEQIIQGLALLNNLFQVNYKLDDGYKVYTEISKVVPYLVELMMTSKDIQIINRIRSHTKRYTTFPEIYDALVDVFHRNIEESNTSLDAGKYLVNFDDRLLDTQNLYLEALQSPIEYKRLMGLKLIYELSGKALKYATPKKATKAKKTEKSGIKKSIADQPNIDGLLSGEILAQLFLDIAATDKSPQARSNAWYFAGGGHKPENIDYMMEDILKSVLYDIVTQFQTGVQVQLNRIIDLIGNEPFNRLKELVDRVNESQVKITEEQIITVIQELLEDQQLDGSYFEMEQVFVLGKIDKKQFKPKSFRKNFLCIKCLNPIELDTKTCPSCKTEVIRCMVCKRPISYGEETASCPKCQNQSHLAHLHEWIKINGKCPVCSAKLKENDIMKT